MVEASSRQTFTTYFGRQNYKREAKRLGAFMIAMGYACRNEAALAGQIATDLAKA